jgi:hypothetical protein
MKQLKDLVPKNKFIAPKSKLLSFKEFCQYVYEPTQRIKALNLPEEERLELEELIERRKRL